MCSGWCPKTAAKTTLASPCIVTSNQEIIQCLLSLKPTKEWADQKMFHTPKIWLDWPHIYSSRVANSEYGSPTWSPALLCDTNELERMQKYCYRVATDLEDVWQPPTLISRWEFADLCEVYKYTHGMYKIEAAELFGFSHATICGHSLNLQKERLYQHMLGFLKL